MYFNYFVRRMFIEVFGIKFVIGRRVEFECDFVFVGNVGVGDLRERNVECGFVLNLED